MFNMKNFTVNLVALLVAICMILGSTPMVFAAELSDYSSTGVQVSNQNTKTLSAAYTPDNPSVNNWDELMERMDTIPLPLSTRDEVCVYKLIYYLDEHFVDGEKSHLTMHLEGDEIVNPDLMMLAVNRVVKLFNDDPAHYWFVEWDPIYEDNGDITIQVYVSMDRQKYPVTQMGLGKILPDARFYASAWDFGSGLSDTFSADKWFYNEECLVIVMAVAHLRESGYIYATDYLNTHTAITHAGRFSAVLPGSQRYLLIGALVDNELVVLGYTCSGNVRSVNIS